MCKVMKPPTPKTNNSISAKHDNLINRIALGYLLMEIKFLKSLRSFKSSVSDLESDLSSLFSKFSLIDFLF